MCSLLQVKGFLCLAGEMVVWQRSWVHQHKDFCCNVLSLNAGLQGPLGISICFLSSGVAFVLSCVLQESLRYPQVSPLTEDFPSVCLLEHPSECRLSFSPQEPLSTCLLPLWWLLSLTHASAGVLWAVVLATLVCLSRC